VTFAPAGYTEEDAERLHDAAEGYCHERGPVVDLDRGRGLMSLTITVEAETYPEAVSDGASVTGAVFSRSGLEFRDVTDVHVALDAPERELQPA
jgi:hypothetical protein